MFRDQITHLSNRKGQQLLNFAEILILDVHNIVTKECLALQLMKHSIYLFNFVYFGNVIYIIGENYTNLVFRRAIYAHTSTRHKPYRP